MSADAPRDVVLDHALAQPARLGPARLVCIDGPAGSGKTTLAHALVARADERGLEPALVHTDDLLDGWDGLPDLADRVRHQLVEPLAAGRPARYCRYDWHAGRFGEEETVVQPDRDLVVLEGVGSGDPSYAGLTATLVWVEAPRDVRWARGRDRDGEALVPHLRRWVAQEEAHFAARGTPARADVVVDGLAPVS